MQTSALRCIHCNEIYYATRNIINPICPKCAGELYPSRRLRNKMEIIQCELCQGYTAQPLTEVTLIVVSYVDRPGDLPTKRIEDPTGVGACWAGVKRFVEETEEYAEYVKWRDQRSES
jgi:hypothetical protein